MKKLKLTDTLYDLVGCCDDDQQDIVMYVISQQKLRMMDTLEQLLERADTSEYFRELIDHVMEEVSSIPELQGARVIKLTDEVPERSKASCVHYVPQATTPVPDIGTRVSQLIAVASPEDASEMQYLLASLFSKPEIDVGLLIRKLRTLYSGVTDPTLPQDISLNPSANDDGKKLLTSLTPEQNHTYNMKTRAIEGIKLVNKLMILMKSRGQSLT